MAIQRSAFCLFCDDIRMEIGNKPSFMGVYTGDIVLPPDPPPDMQVVLPRFAIMVWLFCDITDKAERVAVRVFAPPGRTEVIFTEIPPEQIKMPVATTEGAAKFVFSAGFPINNFHLACEGTIEVVVETERETLVAGRLRVRMPGRPDPTLSGNGGTTLGVSGATPAIKGDDPTQARSRQRRRKAPVRP